MGVVDAKYSAVKCSVVPSRWGGSGGLCISYFVFCDVFLILCGATKVGGQGDSGGQM